MNRLIRYFDLLSEVRPKYAHAVAQGKTVPKLHWIPQYCALLVGIIVQPYLQRYITGGSWNLQGLWGWVIAAVFLAIIAFPVVYKRSFDPEKPLPVQLAIIFQTGVGWQSIVGAAAKGLKLT